MRFSLVFSSALCGGAAVSAVALPPSSRRHLDLDLDLGLDDVLEGLDDLIDLTPFLEFTFDLLDPEQAKAEAAEPDEFDPSQVEQPPIPSTDASNGAESGGPQTGSNNTWGGGSAPVQPSCNQPAIRLEWRDLPDEQKAAYVSGINCLMNTPSNTTIFNNTKTLYEDLVEVHRQSTANVHMVAQFLPWHRYYTNIFETLLKEQCGYTGAIPWWDETKDAGHFSQAPMFTEQYLGPAPVKTQDGKGACVTKSVRFFERKKKKEKETTFNCLLHKKHTIDFYAASEKKY